MQIELNPTVTLEIPDKYKEQIDIDKFHRYCQYASNGVHPIFEAQLCEMAFTLFISHSIATSLCDSLSEEEGTLLENWLDMAPKLARNNVTIKWHDDS